MKVYGAILSTYFSNPEQRRNLRVLALLLVLFVFLLVVFAVTFQWLMAKEGQSHSWVTAVYWTIVTMSTLGFGDIIFHTDAGRIFSLVVLLSGSLFMLVLLPFTVIQFFFIPLMEMHRAARTPTSLPTKMRGHVLLTNLGAIEESLIRMLKQSRIEYAVIVEDPQQASRLSDEGYRVILGALDDTETYRAARAEQAVLVASTLSDSRNCNVAFSVRELCADVPIVCTAAHSDSIDILELAGSTRVVQLGQSLGKALGRRVLGGVAKCHEIGRFDDLVIAEVPVAHTPLVGRSLRAINLRAHVPVNVIGVWERGHFIAAGPETVIHENSVLVLTGTREQLRQFDSLFCIYQSRDPRVLIIGAGRVGRGAAALLDQQGVEYAIVERQSERNRDPARYIIGDAADLKVLKAAGIDDCSAVIITTHDDDTNVFLTIYCRKLRPDVQILARSNVERNVSTLHRAGADFVLSYASIGATALFNLLKRTDILLVAEGLHVFRLPAPASIVGKSLAESHVPRDSGCIVIAVYHDGLMNSSPSPHQPIPQGADLILIGDAEAEARFHHTFM